MDDGSNMKAEGHILAFNAGSSSLKFQLFAPAGNTVTCLSRGAVSGLGDKATFERVYRGRHERDRLAAVDHATATRHVLAWLARTDDAGRPLLDGVAAIGHRIVHGGDRFVEPILLTDATLASIDALGPLAPLHNPPALAVVRICRERLPDIPMAGVFDTAFFHALPDHVRAYALPAEWTERSTPVRRYGFHGLAHRYMAERSATVHTASETMRRVITLQLGHGCSIAAVRDGQAIETSMGFTPLEGLIMATRPGDVDAGVVLHLLGQAGVTAAALNDGLNHRAGLLGLSGVTADMRKLLELEAQGHAGAHLAVEAFCHRARKYIGAYLAVLGGADAIVFGGGIGEHAAALRARICAGMAWCGLQLDAQSNRSAVGVQACISAAAAAIAAYVIPVNEEELIAQDTRCCLRPAHTREKHFTD